MVSKQSMEIAYVGKEMIHFDLNDVLDILPASQPKRYNIIFSDGEIWWNAKMRKTVVDKFTRLKKKRGQIDEM